MASITVPCPKCSVVATNGAWSRNSSSKTLTSFLKPGSSSVPGCARFPSSKNPKCGHFPVLKAQIQEVSVESPSNSSPLVSSKPDSLPLKSEDAGVVEESADQDEVTDISMISAFMNEVYSLVDLVDSKDITELHLKKDGCELLIRKKEAIPQPPVPASPVVMQYPQAMLPPQPAVPNVVPPVQANPAEAAPAPALLPPPKAGSKSSLPPLKSPMAGTFYRCPAPGVPPFVNVGDEVQKGQVVCIIEAMKLMNEIEADKSGTVVEILLEDAKPVSANTPLFIIQP